MVASRRVRPYFNTPSIDDGDEACNFLNIKWWHVHTGDAEAIDISGVETQFLVRTSVPPSLAS